MPPGPGTFTVNVFSGEFWMGFAALCGVVSGAITYFVRVGKSDERQTQLALQVAGLITEVRQAKQRQEDFENKLQTQILDKMDRLTLRLSDMAREVSELKGYRMGAPRRKNDEDDDGR